MKRDFKQQHILTPKLVALAIIVYEILILYGQTDGETDEHGYNYLAVYAD